MMEALRSTAAAIAGHAPDIAAHAIWGTTVVFVAWWVVRGLWRLFWRRYRWDLRALPGFAWIERKW